MSEELPACGLYRTTVAIGEVPEDRLVYFHNHGDPGPGIYLPEGWEANRAKFSSRGQTLPDPSSVSELMPLTAEGFYRVKQAFHCCEKKCREFAPEMLVQLGYNGDGRGILFVPRWTGDGFEVPERGTAIDDDRFEHLRRLQVPEAREERPSAVH